MQYLVDFSRTEVVQRLTDVAFEYLEVHGVSLRTDWVWRTLNRSRGLLDASSFSRLLNSMQAFTEFRASPEWIVFGSRIGSSMDEESVPGVGLNDDLQLCQPIDLAWSPPKWPWTADRTAPGSSTYVFTVSVVPGTAAETVVGMRERLDGIAREANVPTRVEVAVRPVAHLQADLTTVAAVRGGEELTANARPVGTAGGVMRDQAGAGLIATCSHVVEAANPYDLTIEAVTGPSVVSSHVAWRSALMPVAGPCTYASAQGFPDVDFAALRPNQVISSDCEIGGVGLVSDAQAIAQLPEGGLVETAGAVTGLQTLRVGEFVLAHKFDLGGVTYGLRDLFQLRRISRFWAAAGVLRRPIAAGDSGGWVLHQGPTGTLWAGTIVGGDGALGYACFAERVLEAARNAGTTLSL